MTLTLTDADLATLAEALQSAYSNESSHLDSLRDEGGDIPEWCSTIATRTAKRIFRIQRLRAKLHRQTTKNGRKHAKAIA
jgi:hypothetical protein